VNRICGLVREPSGFPNEERKKFKRNPQQRGNGTHSGGELSNKFRLGNIRSCEHTTDFIIDFRGKDKGEGK